MQNSKKKRGAKSFETSKEYELGPIDLELLALPNDAARVAMLMDMSNQADRVSPARADHSQKSDAKATKLRQEGNAYFEKGLREMALLLYTESIACAPSSSPALSLAFANRAAVLKGMGYYEDSIADSQRSLKAGYPEKLHYKLFTRQGNCYQKLGQTGRALNHFNQANDALENCAGLNDEAKNRIKQNIEADLKYCDDDEEEDILDLTQDGTIGVIKFDVPSLGLSTNLEVPAASDCVALKYSPKFGRHFVATRDIEPGEVLIVEEPFAAVMKAPSYSHCTHCFRMCRTLLPCPKCSWAMFCSQACMEVSYNYHGLECAIMPAFRKSNIQEDSLLLARIVFCAGISNLKTFLMEERKRKNVLKTDEEKRTAGFNQEGKYVSTDLHAVANLCFHEPQIFPLKINNCLKAGTLMQLLQLDKLPFSHELGGFLAKFISSVQYNCNGVTEFHQKSYTGEYKPLGVSIYPTFALLNHSCNGNTMYHFYGKTKVVRASQPIKKNSQVFTIVTKSFLKYPRELRQNFLKQNLRFVCDCDACEGYWPVLEKLPVAPRDLQPEEQTAISSSFAKLKEKATGDPEFGWRVTEETLPLFREHMLLLDRLGKTYNQQYYRMVECVRNYYNSLGNYVADND